MKRRRRSRPSVQPRPTVEFVDAIFRRLKLDATARAFLAMRAFTEAAHTLKARARAERLRGTTLYVRVASAAWSQQLHALKAELLEKTRAIAGGDAIHDLRFEVGPLEEIHEWRPEDPRAPMPTPQRAPPSDTIVHAMGEVKDADLRDDLVRLYLHMR